MNVKVENLEKNVVQLEIEVEAEKFEKAMEQSYKKNVGKYSVPGFRKGKVPRRILERYFGEGVLYEDAINLACPEAYEEAVAEQKLEPVERPDINIKQIGEGEALVFTATVTVKPEVGLGEYKGVEVEKVEVDKVDEKLEEEIKKVQDKNARMVSVEDRAIQAGDIAVIDFEGFVDGVAFNGGKGEDYSLEIGSGQFIPGFEDQLVGVAKDADVEVNVNFPDEYHSEELAGKPAMFKVKINDIKFKQLPELDDEFAKDISEFDTWEEYKNSLKEKLEEKAEIDAKRKLEDSIVEKVVANATVDIPQVMIDNRIDTIISDFDLNLRYQGLDLRKYLELMGMDLADFRKKFEERAEKEVRSSLVIEKISQVEKIEVKEEDVEKEIETIADSYNTDVEEFRKALYETDLERIKEGISIKKTVEMLVGEAVIK